MYETDITKDAILLPLTFTDAGSGPKLTSDSSIAMIGYDKRKQLYQILHVKHFAIVYHPELQRTQFAIGEDKLLIFFDWYSKWR